MAIEIVDLPIKNGGSFHSYVKLPEGKSCTNVAFETPFVRPGPSGVHGSEPIAQ